MTTPAPAPAVETSAPAAPAVPDAPAVFAGRIPGPNPLDRALLAHDGPQQPVVTLVLDFPGPAPEPAALRRRLAERAPGLPAFHATPDPGARLRPGRAPDAAALDAETDRISRLPFDLGTEPPPWDLHLITGPDTFRICLRTHHGFLDGVGATHAAAALLADTPAEGARLHPSVPPTLRAAARTLYELARTLAGPRAWTPPPAPDSDPGPGLGSARQTAGRDVPLPVLRRIADAHGATVHQVALAALGTVLADLRREHHSDDARRPAVASVVMSTRTPAERHLPGNRLGVHRLRLPQRADTLDAALAAVVRRTAAARSRRRRDALRALLAPRVAPGLGVRLYAAALRADASPLVVSSVTLPDGLTAFGAPLRGAGLLVHAFEGFPAYVSFTRAAGLVRCHAAADPGRGALLRVPDRWAALLLAHDGGAS